MKNAEKTNLGNQLERIRLSRNLLPEQVASLLGFKTTRPIRNFEKGLRTPDLKTALKLAIIYNVPIGTLLDRYFEACLKEVHTNASRVGEMPDSSYFFDFCTFENELCSKQVSRASLANIRRHSSDLIRKTTEKIGHI